MKDLHILVVNPLWPRPSHATLSANVVFFELIKAFTKQPNTKISFLKINKPADKKPSVEDIDGINKMTACGVNILKPLDLPFLPKRRAKLLRFLSPRLEDFYPELAHKKLAEKVIMAHKPDVLFIPWAEWATALCAGIPVVKFAYYGNPDAKSALAMAEFNYKHGVNGLTKYLAQKIAYKHLERLHLNIMSKYEILGNVAANDVQYYTNKGHPNSFYIQNIWIDRFGETWRQKRAELENKEKPVIIGNIGRLAATANTYGLEVLGRDVLPELKKIMGEKKYEVHLFGVDKIHSALDHYFKRPEVRVCGFVQDVDERILSSQVFLCVNNASAYKVCHTRYLHAWSLGCCVIGHVDAVLSMPEMINGENILLGKDPKEMARLIADAIASPDLRYKIGEGGYKTFKEKFTAESVVPQAMDKICEYMSAHH